ncbi:MAG TPA: 50S ribosomal protein L1 [Candidatus Deferrimicrobium sp.]|nr:50S ribosomal protein L1 [Candidatus Deferrimicrobium sp.]
MIDPAPIKAALKKLKETTKTRKFNQSFDLSITIKDVDLKQPKNRITAEVFLPNPIAESRKICVIGTGDLGVRAKNMGLEVLDKEDLDKLKSDKKVAKKFVRNVDIFIAGVDLMPVLAKTLGPVLGPTGKMPLGPPKGKGIIPPNADLTPIVEEYNKMVRIRLRNNLSVNCKVGNEKMLPAQIAENIQSVTHFLEDNLEHGLRNIAGLYIKTTMGPSIKIGVKGG